MSTPAAEVVTPDMTDPNSTQLYINNLNFDTTVDGLVSFFQQRLSLTPHDVNIVTNKYNGRSKGFGFLRVPKDKVEAACSLSGSMLDEREVKVVEAIVRTPEERQAERDARDARRKEQSARRREERAANAASNPTAVEQPSSSSSPPAERERRPRAPRPERKVYPDATQLYVSNLSYDVTKEQLKAVVDEAIGAESLEVDIVMRRVGKFKGRSRGYGFITVPNDKVDQALQLTGREMEGRAISVVIAKERKPEEEEGQGGEQGAANGEEKEGGAAPKRRTRPPRRRGPRNPPADGAVDPSKDAEAVAAQSEGTTVAMGSSAPVPQVNGQQHKNVPKKPRNRKGGAGAASAAQPDVGGGAAQ